MVDALDAAHERGIVHRDLKPANIKITSDGVTSRGQVAVQRDFRASLVENGAALIVNRSDRISHIAMFDRFWTSDSR